MTRYNVKHKKSQKEKCKSTRILLFIICITCVSILIYNTIVFISNKKIYNEINTENTKETSKTENNITENVKKVIDLKKENSDVIGWIQIDNTIINYPILQTADNNFYLEHNYKKEKSKYGSIYLHKNSNIMNINSNLIIYGHNMKDEQMFNTLLKYEDVNFYNEHKKIKIATETEENQYEIVSVFKSRIFYQDEKDVFRYYNYINFKDEAMYNEYIENCKKIQLYDTGVSVKYGEQLITLITCEYSQKNGRIVVVAKKEV